MAKGTARRTASPMILMTCADHGLLRAEFQASTREAASRSQSASMAAGNAKRA